MLEIWVIILMGGVLLGAVGVLFSRWRRAVPKPTDRNDQEAPVVPLLYMPQPRNTSGAPTPWANERNLTAPSTSRQSVPAKVAKYIGPTPGPGFEGIVQLLPGRLEPIDGTVDQEIRFIKTSGENRFTFGRSTGPAATHIQLLAPTASRMHAYMVMENGRWRIGNMSATNQVLVNGAPLQSGEAERWLEDGDRIELGEVGFIFRER
ncbi:MAG TPA: FHA domain-containing protein [Longimicrobiales bacterium]|nr:FHA domain-containing protein [Longimicrobiales bacterium]